MGIVHIALAFHLRALLVYLQAVERPSIKHSQAKADSSHDDAVESVVEYHRDRIGDESNQNASHKDCEGCAG